MQGVIDVQNLKSTGTTNWLFSETFGSVFTAVLESEMGREERWFICVYQYQNVLCLYKYQELQSYVISQNLVTYAMIFLYFFLLNVFFLCFFFKIELKGPEFSVLSHL